MSASLATNIPLPPTPAVVDEDRRSVASDDSDATSSSNSSHREVGGSSTQPSSPETTQELDVDPQPEVAVLADDPFDSEATRALFNAIDQFQSCGAGRYAPTPQLVVVGAQSVGKSSLLQSLTDVPFPIGEGCCTRFATRIVSTRTAPGTSNRVEITITPPDFDAEYFDYAPDTSYEDFRWEGTSLGVEEFKKIVEEASTKYMGIDAGLGKNKKNFAVEVLKVKISGPGRSHFSILDLPGIISNDYNVRESEMTGVRNMVIKYMSQPEHIVICVADACVDLANQDIFRLATSHVDKSRLIGVYTKCDLTNSVNSTVRVVNGTDKSVGSVARHEWFVVRNKAAAENDDATFDLAEAERALFSKAPWNTIPPTRRGSSMLRKYLGKLLCDKICGTFPALFEALTAKLNQANLDKDALGPPRDTFTKRREFIIDIAKRYQKLALEAVERPWLLEDERCRLRTTIRKANERFADEMRTRGHLHEFEDQSMTEEECITRLNATLFPDLNGEVLPTVSSPDGTSQQQHEQLGPPVFGGQGRRLSKKAARQASRMAPSNSSPLLDMIRKEVATCSSTQLPGMVHPDVVSRLYKLQTAKWREIAEQHISAVVAQVASTITAILENVCQSSIPANTVANTLLSRDYAATEEQVRATLTKFCQGDQTKILQTTDPGFVRKHQLLRSLRMANGIRKAQNHVTSNKGLLSAEEIGRLICDECHFSSTENAVLSIHDTLKAYYEVSLNAFIRHVNNNIVEDYLSDPKSPLWTFTQISVYSRPQSDIDSLGSESSEVVEKREKLSKEIETLNSVMRAGQAAMAKATTPGQ